jgi:E3 ubiquitin-protein ligase SDIR1
LLEIVDDTGLNTSRSSSSNLEEEELTCAICLDTLEHQSKVVALPCKAHIFHAVCIEKWIKNNAVCPECRFEVTVKRLDEQKKEIKDS